MADQYSVAVSISVLYLKVLQHIFYLDRGDRALLHSLSRVSGIARHPTVRAIFVCHAIPSATRKGLGFSYEKEALLLTRGETVLPLVGTPQG